MTSRQTQLDWHSQQGDGDGHLVPIAEHHQVDLTQNVIEDRHGYGDGDGDGLALVPLIYERHFATPPLEDGVPRPSRLPQYHHSSGSVCMYVYD